MLNAKLLDTIVDLRLEALDRGKDIYFDILSSGMRYLITTKDKVLVRRVGPEQLNIGDIAVYRRKDTEFTLHRVISKRHENDRIVFITKADFYKHVGSPVQREQIIGKVVAVKKSLFLLRLDTAFGKAISWLMAFYSGSCSDLRYLADRYRKIPRKILRKIKALV